MIIDESRLGALPRRGPFRIKTSFIAAQLFKAFLWFVVFAAGAGLIGGYGIYSMLQLTEVAKIWNTGQPAQSLGYRGKILSFEEAINPQTNKPIYTYYFAFEREINYEAVYTAQSHKEQPIVLDSGQTMVILASQTGGHYWILSHIDGHPLVL
jgi:hypothetical protein